MANKNPHKLGVIRGQQTEYNPKWCPISLASENQIQAKKAEGEQAMRILSSEESERRHNIVEAHLTLNHTLVLELTNITVGYMIQFCKASIKGKELEYLGKIQYKDFIKPFKMDFIEFDSFTTNLLLENNLDETTSERILTGIKKIHIDAIMQGGTFYNSICDKMQTEKESFRLLPSDIRAL